MQNQYSDDDFIISLGNDTIDFGNTINISGSVSIDILDDMSSITAQSSIYNTSYGKNSPYVYNTSTIGGIVSPYQLDSNINGNLNISDGGDIKIGNSSLKELMAKMEDRFAILQPDPEKLEKFEALKAAYEHYKLLESLCNGSTPEEPNDKR